MTPLPVLLSALALLPITQVAGQEAPRAGRFGDEAEVVAVDVTVELPGGGGLGGLLGGRTPGPDELEARAEDGTPLPVIAVQEPAAELGRLVLYFDLSLSDDYQLEWSADLLAQGAGELVALAPVEVVVADPVARTVLPPTRNASEVEETLARLAFFGEAQDALVEARIARATEGRTRRAGATGALPLTGDGQSASQAGSGTGPGEGSAVATSGSAGEAAVRRSLDTLLLTLVERSDEGDPRRAVLLSSGGFDLEAASDRDPSGVAATEDASSRPTVLTDQAQETGRTLAAYGWRVVPLLAPERGGPVAGLRLGKLRLGGADSGALATWEEDRDPELAEAHLERARSLRGQGRSEQAAEAAETAVHHFAGDPRTGRRQAEALVLLAELHHELGDPQRARRALRRAARYAPDLLADHPVTAALPRAPEAGLAALAEPGTAGKALPATRSGRDFRRALGALNQRSIVTVQLPGPPDGALHRVELRPKDRGRSAPLTAWARFGTPEAVQAATSLKVDRGE